jgi:hypothetical protein
MIHNVNHKNFYQNSGENMEPTNLQVFMGEVNKTAKTETIGVYHQVPFRMSTWNFERLEGLRNYMSEPRNKVLNSLIEIALDQVFSELEKGDENIKNAILSECAKVNAIQKHDGSGDLDND